jgi:hypothetical protein
VLLPGGMCRHHMRRGSPADPLRGGFKVLITGPHGLERSISLALDEEPVLIVERAREWLEVVATMAPLTLSRTEG